MNNLLRPIARPDRAERLQVAVLLLYLLELRICMISCFLQMNSFLTKNFIIKVRGDVMGRELRMVPADWEHPKKGWQDGYRPLLSGYRKALEEFKEDVKAQGLEDALEYWGGGPYTHNYMPEWAKDEATHYMMYETCTEGTPISPAFATKEELAHWLADTGASAFGKRVASYEAWLNTIEAGYAPSAVLYQVGTR